MTSNYLLLTIVRVTVPFIPIVYTIKTSSRHKQTRMTTFIKTKFNKSDDQTHIDNTE